MTTIAIDAGHFKSHPGAVSAGVREVDQNKAVIEHLKAQLTYQGFNAYECVGTSGNQKEAARQKARIANNAKAEIYIAVHCNSSINPLAQGCEVWTFPGSAKGAGLGNLVLDEVVRSFNLRNRGRKEKKFIVLTKTKMPAALLEWGFISHSAERYMIQQPANHERCAKAITYAILRYFGKQPSKEQPTQVLEEIQRRLVEADRKIEQIRAIVS